MDLNKKGVESKKGIGKKFIWIIILGVFTYWFLMVLVHETGHIIFGTILGYQIQSIVWQPWLPYGFGGSGVNFTVPVSQLVAVGGTLFAIIVGFLLTMLPRIYSKVIGGLLMFDGINYPRISLTTGFGDFAMVPFFYIPLFIILTIGFYGLSSYINRAYWFKLINYIKNYWKSLTGNTQPTPT